MAKHTIGIRQFGKVYEVTAPYKPDAVSRVWDTFSVGRGKHTTIPLDYWEIAKLYEHGGQPDEYGVVVVTAEW